MNRKLVYTHGYGVVVSPATEFTEEGQPEFYIKDVPPTGILTVNQPRIYYGENTTDFVVVSTREPEFDHPAIEEGAQPVYISSYDGLGGVRLSSFLRRLAYAWEFADINVLISSQITGESRTLYRRAISERVSTVAPFLSLDQDPYMVVTEDGLFWIQDAYTTTDRFPYSKRLDEQDFNYIRNSVKVVLDAYNGSLTFYIIEPGGRRDPLVRVYQQIFPDLFRPIEEMPLSLQSHIRYPEVLLRAQAQTYLQYHMIDSKEFFLKEDQWEIPNEVVLEGISQPVEPYYVIMKLRGEEREEFVLILPFTPQDKPNLVAWMAARSDGEHYGDILAFRFPKDRLFNGPSQIEARIDNDPKISEQFHPLGAVRVHRHPWQSAGHPHRGDAALRRAHLPAGRDAGLPGAEARHPGHVGPGGDGAHAPGVGLRAVGTYASHRAHAHRRRRRAAPRRHHRAAAQGGAAAACKRRWTRCAAGWMKWTSRWRACRS